MKKLPLLFFLFFIFKLIVAQQWQQLNGPYGGSIQCIATDGTNIFAGTKGYGIFRSSNNGINWVAVNNGLPADTAITSIVINNSKILSVNYYGDIYQSDNNGLNWSLLSNGAILSAYSLFIYGSKIYACTYDGIFVSLNNGINWTALNNGLSHFMTSLAIKDSILYAGSSSYGVYFSNNYGVNWLSRNNGITTNKISSMLVYNNKVFSGTDSGIFISNINDTVWYPKGLSNYSIKGLVTNGNTIYAGTYGGGIFLSNDTGTTWSSINTGLTDNRILSLTINGNNIYAGTDGGGLFLSTNNGISWIAINTGIIATTVTNFTKSGSTVFAGTNGAGIFSSSNQGLNWLPLNNGLTNTNVQSIAISGNEYYAGTEEGFFISLDNGASWVKRNNGFNINWVPNIYTLAIKDTDIYAGTEHGLYKSLNKGLNWLYCGPGGLVDGSALSGENIYIGIRGGSGLFLSTNNGASWVLKNNGIAHPNILRLVTNNTDIFTISYGDLYRSSDSANTWASILHDADVRDIAIKNSTIYAAIGASGLAPSEYFYGVAKSLNYGWTWETFNSGFLNMNVYVYSLIIMGDYLYAGTDGYGIWKYQVGTSNEEKILKNIGYLIYPNPVENVLTIETSNNSQRQKIEIFNITGQAVFIDDFNNKKTFDISSLSQGTYILKLSTDKSTTFKKILKLE